MENRGKNRAGARVPREASPVGICKVRFSVALWNKWLAEFNSEPASELVQGIEEFRALCNKPLASDHDVEYGSPMSKGENK